MQKNKYLTPSKEFSEVSMGELKTLRSLWLKDGLANGHIDACFKVGRELGRRVDKRGVYPFYRWSSGDPANLKPNDIILDYTEVGGDYLRAEQRYSVDKIVIVSIGWVKWKRGIMMGDHNNRVLHYAKGDDLTERSKQNIFVPGNWLDPIIAALPAADKALKKMIRDKNEGERDKLITLLSTG